MIRALVCAATVAATFALAGANAEAQPQDEESALLVEEARAAFGRGAYEAAGKLLDRAIEVNPRRVDAYVLLGTVYGLLDRHADAVQMLERAKALAPRNPDVLTTLGNELILAGRAPEGIPVLEAVVADWPQRYQAHVVLGHHYAHEHDWSAAIVSLEAYLTHRPGSLAGEDNTHLADLANAYLRSNDADQARVLYERVLSTDADSVLGRLGLAWSWAAIDCRKALRLLRKMEDLAETYAEVLSVRGRCALASGKREEALETAGRYLERRPDHAAAWALLGEAHAANHELVEARRRLEGAIARDSSNAVYAMRLAGVERADGLPAAAVARLRAAGIPAGYDQEWTVELVEALHDDRQFAEVLSELTAWTKAHGDSAWANALMGIALLELAETDQAIEHLERALQQDPGQERAKEPLVDAFNTAATIELGAGRRDAAEALLERAAAVSDDPLTARNLGVVRLMGGEVAKAIEVLEPLESGSDDIALHVLGRAYAASGRWADATATLRRALALELSPSRAVDVTIDLAAAELAGGDASNAVTVLETMIGTASAGDQADRLATAYIAAARAAATQAMNNGAFTRAYRLLARVHDALPTTIDAPTRTALECDLALAATGAKASSTALTLLRTLSDGGAACEFAAPADDLAIPILIAWNEGANARYAKTSLEKLGKLRRKASGAAEALLETAGRDIAMQAAIAAYGTTGKDLEKARYFLAQAQKFGDKSDQLVHNLAVVDLASGKTDQAIVGLEKVAKRVAEAPINLGIAYEAKDKPLEALDQWRKAASSGVVHKSLAGWIGSKETFWENP